MAGFTLDSLRAGTKSARIMVNGKPFKFDVASHAVTNELMDEYREASDPDDRDYDVMAHALSQIIVRWDLTDTGEDDGEMVPITGDLLRTLPLEFIGKLWDEVNAMIIPKSRKKSGS